MKVGSGRRGAAWKMQDPKSCSHPMAQREEGREKVTAWCREGSLEKERGL